MLAYILQGITLGFSAGVSPGALQAYFLSQTLKNGWKRTLPAAFAPLLSDGPIILLVLFVLSQTPDWLRRGLQLAGGVYVIYLAWGAWRTFRQPVSEPTPGSKAQSRSLREAAIMNLLNPAPYIFWGTILGPILISGWREAPRLGLGFILGFYVSMIVIYIGIILLFGTTRELGPRVTRSLSGVSALGLFVFGLFQIWMGILG